MTFLKRLKQIVFFILFSFQSVVSPFFISNPAICTDSVAPVAQGSFRESQSFTCGQDCFLMALYRDCTETSWQLRLWKLDAHGLLAVEEITLSQATHVIGPIGHGVCGDRCFMYAVVADAYGHAVLKIWQLSAYQDVQAIALLAELPMSLGSGLFDPVVTVPINSFKDIGIISCQDSCLLYAVAQISWRCSTVEVLVVKKLDSPCCNVLMLDDIDPALVQRMNNAHLPGWSVASFGQVSHVACEQSGRCSIFAVRHLQHDYDRALDRDDLAILSFSPENEGRVDVLFGDDQTASMIEHVGGFSCGSFCNLHLVRTTDDERYPARQSTLSFVTLDDNGPALIPIADPEDAPLGHVGVVVGKEWTGYCPSSIELDDICYMHYVQTCTGDRTQILKIVRLVTGVDGYPSVVPIGQIDGVDRGIMRFEHVGISTCCARSFMHAVIVLNDDTKKLAVWEFDTHGMSRTVIVLPLVGADKPDVYTEMCNDHCILITRTDEACGKAVVRGWDITQKESVEEADRFFIQYGVQAVQLLDCSERCLLAVQQYHQMNVYDMGIFLNDPLCLVTEQVGFIALPSFDKPQDLIHYLDVNFPGCFKGFLEELCSGAFTIPIESLVFMVESGLLSFSDIFCVLRLFNPSDPCHRLYHYPEDRLTDLFIAYARSITDHTCFASQLPFDLLLPLTVPSRPCDPEYSLSCVQLAGLLDAWIPADLSEIEFCTLAPWVHELLTETDIHGNRWYSCDTGNQVERDAVFQVLRALLRMGCAYPSEFYRAYLTDINPDRSFPIIITTPFMMGLLDPAFNALFARVSFGNLIVALFARWASHPVLEERFDLSEQLDESIFGVYQLLLRPNMGGSSLAQCVLRSPFRSVLPVPFSYLDALHPVVLSGEQTLEIVALGAQNALQQCHAIPPEVVLRIVLRAAQARQAGTDACNLPLCSSAFLVFAKVLVKSLANFDAKNCGQQNTWDQFWQGPVGTFLQQITCSLDVVETRLFKQLSQDTPFGIFPSYGTTRTMCPDRVNQLIEGVDSLDHLCNVLARAPSAHSPSGDCDLALSFRNRDGVICFGLYPAKHHDNGVNWYEDVDQIVRIDKGILCFEINISGEAPHHQLPSVYKTTVSGYDDAIGVLNQVCHQIGRERCEALISLLKDKICCNAPIDVTKRIGSSDADDTVRATIKGELVIENDQHTNHTLTIDGACVKHQKDGARGTSVCDDLFCPRFDDIHVSDVQKNGGCTLVKGWCWFDPKTDLLAVPSCRDGFSIKTHFTTNIQPVSSDPLSGKWYPTVFTSDHCLFFTSTMTEEDFRNRGLNMSIMDTIMDPCVRDLICNNQAFYNLFMGKNVDAGMCDAVVCSRDKSFGAQDATAERTAQTLEDLRARFAWFASMYEQLSCVMKGGII